MPDLASSVVIACRLILTLNAELIGIVALSLFISLSATLIALIVGAPIGALLAVAEFPGRKRPSCSPMPSWACRLSSSACSSICCSLARDHSADLVSCSADRHDHRPNTLTTPIVVALVHRFASALWSQYGDVLQTDGASPLRSIRELLMMGTSGVLTASLAAFGRAIAEVGAIIIVGGNIRGSTRTMTTAIALETSKGDLPLALALGLILIFLSILVSATAFHSNAGQAVCAVIERELHWERTAARLQSCIPQSSAVLPARPANR